MGLDDDGTAGRQRRGRIAASDGKRQRKIAGAEDCHGTERDLAHAQVHARQRLACRLGRVDAQVEDLAGAPDGRFLYVANRGEHALLVYGVDAASGQLALLQRIGSGGETPWSFALHASGKWLLVANQRSGGVHVFGVDTASGMLSDAGIAVAVATPVNLSFMP